MDENEWLADRFEEHRAHLRAVAYRMLGSLTEADDAVQDTWLRLSRSGADGVENLGGWLTTIVARVCLNMLRSRTTRREEALGVHLPDPVISPAGRAPARGGGGAGRLGRPRPPGRARHPVTGGAARLRAPRHVPAALRGDRSHGRPVPDGGQAARQPGTAAGQRGRAPGARPRPGSSTRRGRRLLPGRPRRRLRRPRRAARPRRRAASRLRRQAARRLRGGPRRGGRRQAGGPGRAPGRRAAPRAGQRRRRRGRHGRWTAVRGAGVHRRRGQDRRDRRHRRPRSRPEGRRGRAGRRADLRPPARSGALTLWRWRRASA